MSSSEGSGTVEVRDRPGRRMLVLGLAALAGCGFRPAYGPGGSASGLHGQIAVDPPRDEPGFIFVRQLEDRLGRPEAPPYRLAADVRLDQDGVAVTPEEDITRYQVRARVGYRVIDAANGAVLTSGSVSNFTSYSAPVFDDTRGSIAGNTVSVRAAERDAIRRLMVILADQIVARLVATAAEWRGV